MYVFFDSCNYALNLKRSFTLPLSKYGSKDLKKKKKELLSLDIILIVIRLDLLQELFSIVR